MASNSHIQKRNQEIREIWRHLRKIKRKESSYCFEFLAQNYFVGKDRVYAIILEPDCAGIVTMDEASIVYKAVMNNQFEEYECENLQNNREAI